ncbi:MAG: ABC transporter permease [Chloroflexi bacterium]|nr:MAG: ABC transporter permease [Chloroflexota bacterium]
MDSGATLEELEQRPDYDVQLESLNQWQLAWRRFKRHRMALLGSALFLFMVVVGLIGPFIIPYDDTKIGLPDAKFNAGRPPSIAHLFGDTGRLHRDVLTLVVNGTRLSLLIGVLASAISAIVGTFVGGIAGYFGGWLDTILMRIVDALLSLPLLFVILAFSQFLGEGHASWPTMVLIFGMFGWLGIARLVRAVMLSLREEDYVDAARAAGVSDVRIIFRHLVPNSLSPIIVATTLGVAGVIIGEAFVSFLGFGVDPATPTLGNILSGALEFISQGNWWWAFFPGAAIVLIVLGINFMGDGLRDALDPRAKV